MADTADSRRRWDTDDRFVGVADASSFAGAVVELAAEHGPGDSSGEIRWRAWALIGAVAEPAASVRERRDGDTIIFEIITGIPDRSGPFASHGHTLRLTIRPPGAA